MATRAGAATDQGLDGIRCILPYFLDHLGPVGVLGGRPAAVNLWKLPQDEPQVVGHRRAQTLQPKERRGRIAGQEATGHVEGCPR